MRKSRLLSFALAFTMVFTMLPQTFAVSEKPATGATDDSNDTAKGTSVAGWGSSTKDHAGMRFSLYFSETKATSIEEYREQEKTGKDLDFVQVGVLDVVQKGMDYIQRSSTMTVFERMEENEDGMLMGQFMPIDWSSTGLSIDSVAPNFPGIYENYSDVASNYGNSETEFKYKYMKYFCGLAKEIKDEDWTKSKEDGGVDLTNLLKITDKIVADNTDWKEYSFKDGWYIDNFGKKVQGVFKFYFEPTVQIFIDSVGYAVTLRDLIAFANENTNMRLLSGDNQKWTIARGHRTLSQNMANAVFLTSDEPLINMKGYSGSSIGSFLTSNDEYDSSSDLYKSGGVGVITGFPRGKFTPPTVKIVTSVVKVDDYKVENNEIVANLSEAEKTTLREGDVCPFNLPLI